MKKYDLAIAYLWEYDEDFIHLLESKFHKEGLTTYIISDHNIVETIDLIKERQLKFSCYLDRAWDVDERFEELGKLLIRRKARLINDYKRVLHAIDKASMHLEFITEGIYVPYSIIIPPFTEKEDIYISISDLARLGRPFIIKPCNNTGGGTGVVTGAESLQHVLEERMTNSEDKYLIQEKIYPKVLNGRRAWFRVFWLFDEVLPVWWDDQTHIYEILSEEEIFSFELTPLLKITEKIARVAKLDFFSTEIALSEKGVFTVIDYVNDQCDLRLKSLHPDGIPDYLVHKITNKFLDFVLCQKQKS